MRYKLNIFIKVAQHLSFTLASKDLNLSQPADSKTIAKLEEDYNKNLFNRSRDSILLTNEGMIFLDLAHKNIKLFEEFVFIFLLRKENDYLKFHLVLRTTID